MYKSYLRMYYLQICKNTKEIYAHTYILRCNCSKKIVKKIYTYFISELKLL